MLVNISNKGVPIEQTFTEQLLYRSEAGNLSFIIAVIRYKENEEWCRHQGDKTDDLCVHR